MSIFLRKNVLGFRLKNISYVDDFAVIDSKQVDDLLRHHDATLFDNNLLRLLRIASFSSLFTIANTVHYYASSKIMRKKWRTRFAHLLF